ncbi:hypothetical protein niasHT_034302 [Heterodera trifolii]|uniref:Serpin domain-containing protein n=1 Tax=Heterodera trifolii TaxID=157864 RepID=A0ABD2HRR9_9BILA
MANLLAVILFTIIQFELGDSNDQITADKNAINAEELCRPIDGTHFHEQCLQSSVVKQKGFIPRHLRPPWLNSSLFEDNELSVENAKNDGCYGCYKGTKASNGMAPGEEYCACTYKGQMPNEKFGVVFGTVSRKSRICLKDLQEMAFMPTCGNKYFDHIKHCAMVHFYDNDPEKEPRKEEGKERILGLLDGCIRGATKHCRTVNVKVEHQEMEYTGGFAYNCGAGIPFTFPVEFHNRPCWNLVRSERPDYFFGITITLSGNCGNKSFQLPGALLGPNGRVQEMRGLQLDLQTGEAVQWLDPAGGYAYAKQTTLNWQPTALHQIKPNGMPDGALMYPDFVLKPVGRSEFLLDLFKQILLQQKTYDWPRDHTVVAPQLATVGLAIAYIGARGNTKVQIGKVLMDEGLSERLLHENNRKFLQEIQLMPSNDTFKLKMASKMFLSDSVDVLDQFNSTINTFYGSNFEKINFREGTDAANKINEFVRKSTEEGNVSEVIKSSDIKPHHKIILVNVAHFHANWGPLIGQFIYKDEKKFQLIGVPIGNGDNDKLHLVIVVPKDLLDLSLIVRELKGGKLIDLITNSPTTKAKLILPPIKINISYEFENVLPSLGIRNAFNNQSTADFTGMNKYVPLYINKFIHKVSFSIANGTDTQFLCDDKRLAGLPGFEADEPFAFFLVHYKKNILFAGSIGIERRYSKCY